MDEKTKENLARKVQEEVDNSDLGKPYRKGSVVSVNIRPEREKLPPNIMVFQTFAFLSATTLTPSSCKLLMYFFSKSGYENYIGMDVKTLSEDLSMAERTVLRALNELKENGILVKVQNPSDKRRNDYFINPIGAWKGNSYSRKKALEVLTREEASQMHLFGENLKDSTKRETKEIKENKFTVTPE